MQNLAIFRTPAIASNKLVSRRKEPLMPTLRGALVVLDLHCQDVNGSLQILRRGLIKAGAKLVMDVTHDVNFVISNRPFESAPSTEQAEPNPISSSRASSRRRSAQLAQKAILPNSTRTDIVSKAKRFGTKIVSVDAIMKTLAKKSSDVTRELPYYAQNKVALQDLEEHFRPIVKEFPNGVPRMRTDAPPGQCPFVNKKQPDLLATQKQISMKVPTQQMPKKKRRVVVSGYCEICRFLATDVEAHLSSKEHIDRADNDTVWAQVDACITSLKQLSASVMSKENMTSNLSNSLTQTNSQLECDC